MVFLANKAPPVAVESWRRVHLDGSKEGLSDWLSGEKFGQLRIPFCATANHLVPITSIHGKHATDEHPRKACAGLAAIQRQLDLAVPALSPIPSERRAGRPRSRTAASPSTRCCRGTGGVPEAAGPGRRTETLLHRVGTLCARVMQRTIRDAQEIGLYRHVKMEAEMEIEA